MIYINQFFWDKSLKCKLADVRVLLFSGTPTKVSDFPGSHRGSEQWRAWTHPEPSSPWGVPSPQPCSPVPWALSDVGAQPHSCSSSLCAGPAAVPEAQGQSATLLLRGSWVHLSWSRENLQMPRSFLAGEVIESKYPGIFRGLRKMVGEVVVWAHCLATQIV